MITLIALLIIFLIGLIIFVLALVFGILSFYSLFKKSEYDFVASRKDPKDKKIPSKKSSFKPAKNIKAKR